MARNNQDKIFRGIYEYEDAGGTVLAEKVPHLGSVDLYSETAVVVRPTQSVLFLYKGQIADVLDPGVHFIKTENVPILTRLANWRFGFKSPLRCELWFFSKQLYKQRMWGTSKPILHSFGNDSPIPIRSHGNYNLSIKDIKLFYKTLIGSRSSYDISESDGFLQGQVLELLPEALSIVPRIEELNKYQDEVSKKLAILVNNVVNKYGLEVKDMQVLSLVPTEEILKALSAKAAMQIVGDKQEYLLYQAANSLNEIQSGQGGNNQANDPMQMMLGLMLGKSLMYSDPEGRSSNALGVSTMKEARPGSTAFCSNCGANVKEQDKFCSSCGEKI